MDKKELSEVICFRTYKDVNEFLKNISKEKRLSKSDIINQILLEKMNVTT